MRPLTFSDDMGHAQEWIPEAGASELAAFEPFEEFMERHRDCGTFRIEDAEKGEALTLMHEAEAVRRDKEGENPVTEYLLVTNKGDYRALALNFVRGGFAALNFRYRWLPDLATLAKARLRRQFDRSVLRRTHPRELRARLDVLTRIDGGAPETVDGVTHYGYGNGGGDTVNAWFTADGRALIVTFDHEGDLNFYEDGSAQAALYDGVPDDLLALVRDVPETPTTLNAELPDGGTLVAASGVFHLSGPCAMAEGLVSRLETAGLGIADTGVDWLLETFLALEDFTPETVTGTVAWWSAADAAKAFAASTAIERPELPAIERRTIDRFCELWADSGYNDPWDVHYVLFDGEDLEDVEERHAELLALIETMKLERVDSPPGAGSGEVWVRSDPRIDAELGNWA